MFAKHKAIIFGVAGHILSEEEKIFFSETKPLGFVLSSKNITSKEQLASLINSLRNVVNNKYAPIFINHEGGHVYEIKTSIWHTPPPAFVFGRIAHKNLDDAKRALRLSTALIAIDLIDLDLSSGAIPTLDILCDDANTLRSDHLYSSDKFIVTTLGQVVCETLAEFGITPIIKHIPGHGKAKINNPYELPTVDASYEELLDTDFYPFKKLNDARLALTAHVLYKNIDPTTPATLSKRVIFEIRNIIGFKNLLLTDCIHTNILPGSLTNRAEKAIEAGCDIILVSKGTLEEMRAVATPIPPITFNQEKILREILIYNKKHYRFNPTKIKNKLNELLEKYDVRAIA